jgi:hypothetical protein
MSTLKDLNDHLFSQLNRLSNASGEQIHDEIERSKAFTILAREVIGTAALALDAQKQYDLGNIHLPAPMLGVTKRG